MTVQIMGLQVGVSVIVAAAGRGTRVGGGTAKQFLPLRGVPVLRRTVQVIAECPLVDEIIIVASDIEKAKELAGDLPKVTRVVAGGAERQDSVYKGLQQVTARPRIVAVHDAARPLLPADVLDRVLRQAADHPAQVVAVPIKDTVKVVDGAGTVAATPDRQTLWAAQTPQVFWIEPMLTAFRQAAADEYQGTDCASLLERTGISVTVCPGSPENLKLTTPQDFLLAESILAQRGE